MEGVEETRSGEDEGERYDREVYIGMPRPHRRVVGEKGVIHFFAEKLFDSERAISCRNDV